MAKIILSLGDKFLREIPLSKERVTIGRRTHNDIVIEDLAISGEHAVIVTMNNDSFLEDLNSTNGTQVNGQPVRRHYLQDQDCIELAQYRIRYLACAIATSSGPASESSDAASAGSRNAIAKMKVLNGAKIGNETVLSKVITTFGKQDLHTAVILQRSDGYYLAHVDGRPRPLLNGVAVDVQPKKLQGGDVIDLAGDRLQFLLE